MVVVVPAAVETRRERWTTPEIGAQLTMMVRALSEPGIPAGGEPSVSPKKEQQQLEI